jgi:L-lactate dehydrogenase complex protein LldF
MTDPAPRPGAVYFFATCLVDLFYPEAGLAGLQLLRRAGLRVVFPTDQTCCGQPAWNSGYRDEARRVAQAQLGLFPEPWPVLVPSGSCAGMMRHHYPRLFAGTPDQARAEAVAGRVYELTGFLVDVLALRLRDLGAPVAVAVHSSCSACREMGVAHAVDQLLGQLAHVRRVEQAHQTECCGFGGTFAVKEPEISAAMVQDKTAALRDSGAAVVVSQDCGCLMNIGGAFDYQGGGPRTLHIAQFLWERTRDAGAAESAPPGSGAGRVPQGGSLPATLPQDPVVAASVGSGSRRRLFGGAESPFRLRVRQALVDSRVRSNIRKAMDGLRVKRDLAFPDKSALERLRAQGLAIRARALARLPELLERLEARCIENGIRVHWAETAEQGNRIVQGILQDRGVELLVKGKSMVSEEMELNAWLEHHGIECVESDLGEFILQLAGEKPSHIVAPAIHKDRFEVAALFREQFPHIPYSDDIDRLTAVARQVMRDKFRRAGAGLSGVNFLVAETGTLCLVENEGNGRMSTTVPDLHIAVAGIEKVVERLADVPPLLSLLTRSATGQPITTYFNMISGPRRPGERDGPRELHLVLLDNGRSRIYGDAELQATLRCIRCGACMNHCPVYVRLGGHAYGTVYPGPIGSILEPQRQGLEQLGELAAASTLCGACSEVCPVRIPIPELLNRLRWEGVRRDGAGQTVGQGSRRKVVEAAAWGTWSSLAARPALYRVALATASRLRVLAPDQLGAWSRCRSAPKPAARALRQIAESD